MNNRRALSGGGVEDPLAPQPGPSQPAPARHKTAPPSKRKAPDEEDSSAGDSKRTKSSQLLAPANKSKTLKGERKAGGLIINPLPPTSNAAPGPSSTLATAPPPRPPSSQGSSHSRKKPPDNFNITILDQSGSSVPATAAKKSKGKGKAREVVEPTRQDLEVEEDVRRMDAERERLRVREAQAQSQSAEFKEPLLPPPSSVPRRRQTGFAFGVLPSTPGNGKSIDSTQPIPLRDTPTIDRNRVMRGEPVERRRSSLSRRGKRASSSFEHTGVIPQPHASVSTANFHKHMDRELPEAHRARHLLVWCASRTSARPSPSSRAADSPLPPLTAEGANILQEVQKDMQKLLTEQLIDISFSSRMDEDGDRPRVKQHEQNVRNLKREDDFMRHIDRCKREGEAWTSVIQSYNARQSTTIDALSRQRQQQHSSIPTNWTPPDASEREQHGAQLARRCKESASRKRGASPLALRMAEVESKVDRAHRTLHISEQLTKRTTRHLDVRFEALAAALAARSQPPAQVSTLASLVSASASADANPTSTLPSATGFGAPPDTLAILRALARTDAEHPQRERGEAARKAARDVQRVNATPGRAAGGAGMGERRLTAVAPGTPRRAGTPRQRSEGAEGGGSGAG